jgi:hypothetical protein
MNKNALAQLDDFNCTEQYHLFNSLFPRVVATDGAMFLARNADCCWLLEAIASHLMTSAIFRPNFDLFGLHFWKLVNTNNGGARLECERDIDDVVLTQEIPLTDFPFDALSNPRIWAAPTTIQGKIFWVLYLPSEH